MSVRKYRNLWRCLPLKLCSGIIVYIILLASCMIFTQALRSPVSAIACIFILSLPVADIICFILSWLSVGGTVSESSYVISKKEKLNCSLILSNRGFLPVSCTEISLILPNRFGTGCKTEIKKFSLPPFSRVKASIPIRFEYRGIYITGANEIYVYDLFRLFCLKKKIHAEITVKVLPRLLPYCGAASVCENTETSEISSGVSRQTEFGDIRQYLPGDSFKSIHWKLSSKTEELQVRKYVPDSGHIVSIFCDFGGKHDKYGLPSYASAFSDDRIAEEALSAAREAAVSGHHGKLLWKASDCAENAAVSEFSDVGSMSRLALALCEANTDQASPGLSGISETLFGNAMLFVTAFRSSETETAIREAVSLLGSDRVSVCLCDLSEILDPLERIQYKNDLDALYRRITESGIKTVIPVRKTEETELETK